MKILYFYLLFLGALMCATTAKAYTVYTPNATPVYVTIKTETLSNTEIQQKDAYFQNLYPNATLVGHSTGTYNCHGYAWVMSEGGITCWLEQVDVPTYWNDESYVFTSSQYAEKAFYIYDDHSAITTSTPNMYKSKWGTGPLMIHGLHDCPYYLSSDPSDCAAFLAKYPTLSGSDILTAYQQSTYTVSCIPLNTTLSWSYSSSLFTLVSSSGDHITLRPKNANVAGGTYVTANFKDSSNQIVYSCNMYVVVGSPSLRVVRSSDGVEVYPAPVGLSPNTFYYAYLTGYDRYYSITWSPDSHITIYSQSNSMMYFKTDSAGYCLLDIYGKATATGTPKKVLGVTLYGSSMLSSMKEEQSEAEGEDLKEDNPEDD